MEEAELRCKASAARCPRHGYPYDAAAAGEELMAVNTHLASERHALPDSRYLHVLVKREIVGDRSHLPCDEEPFFGDDASQSAFRPRDTLSCIWERAY